MGMAIQCPEQFRQRYIVKTEEKNFGARFVGMVDHDMAHVLTLSKMEAGQQEVSSETIEVLYRESWDRTLNEAGEPDWRDDDPNKMFKTGVKMAKLYWDEVINTEEFEPLACEERIEYTIPGMPFTVIGYLDTRMKGLIRERKTTGQKTTKPKPKWRFQGLLYQYQLGLPVQWDVVTRQVTPQLYLAKDWPDLYLPVQRPGFIEQMIVDTARRMDDLYQRYGADEPWPTTGIFGDWLCDYCPIGPRYGGTCPAWNSGTNPL